MKALPIELRERIIAEVDRNERGITEIATLFRVSQKTIYNLLRLRDEHGSLEPRPHGGGAVAKITPAIQTALEAYVAEHPDDTLEELQTMLKKHHRLRVGITTIWEALDRAGLTVKKKTRRAGEADPRAREAFKRKQARLPADRLWFIDEYGIHLNMTRRYARSPRGQRAVVTEATRTGVKLSAISAMTLDGVQAPMMIEGSIDAHVLRVYVAELLAPELSAGDIVIWDNLHAHKDTEVCQCIEDTGARIEPLPSYSPDLNPKENCISKIKAYLRKVKAGTQQTLATALKRAYARVTPDDVRGWFAHCGYAVT